MTSSEEKHMSDSEKNDDHGKWTYHEYENADGERGYIISGGLLPDDDAVNQKAHELGHDINQQDWVRTEKMEGGPVRYFYRGGAIGDELIEDESKEIGPFYDLSEHNYLAHAMFVSGVAIVLGTIILGVTGSEYPLLGFLAGIGAHEMKAIINNDPPLGFLAGIVGFVPIAVGAAAHDTIPGRRVIDSMGAAITDPAGTPVRVRLSSAMRRLLRRCHVKVDAAPDGWSRIKRNVEVAYIHEHAGTATFVTRDDALDLVLRQMRDFDSVPASSARLVDKSDLVETSASTVIGALQSIVGPTAIPSAAGTLDAEQSRAVMARLRTRTPER
jgi:hypothetical protein